MKGRSGESRVAVITGGAKGLGKAIADRLLSDGLRVAVLARSGPEVQEGGERLMRLNVDVSDEAQVKKAIAEVVRRLGRLDVLVNNAGVAGPIKRVQEIDRDEWERTLGVNLTGAFLCCKHAAPQLVKAGRGGRVVNISSMGWKKALAFRTSYSASKAGLIGFTRALSREMGTHGVTVNAVSPGPIAGDRIEEVWKGTAAAAGVTPEDIRKRLLGASSIGRLSTPREVAALVSFLVSKEGGSITGQEFNADST